MSKYIITVFTLLLSLSLYAAPRTSEQARAVAQCLWERQARRLAAGHAAREPLPRLVATEEVAGEAAYYVFSRGENKGFAIIGSDDRLPPVVGYTLSGDYDAEHLPPALSALLSGYAQTASTRLSVSGFPMHDDIEPYVLTRWGQGYPFALQCPEYAPGKKCPTGCVATAVAQALAYWRHPQRLLHDTPAYSPAYSPGQTPIHVPAIAAGEVFDWDNMLPSYADGYSEAQGEAVARLMLAVGCAHRMGYGPSMSSSNYSPAALVECFGMDRETVYEHHCGLLPDSLWEATLYGEVARRRPVLYAASEYARWGGHAFVIDGYREGLYHVNWGWDGSCDGFFDIMVMMPGNPSLQGRENAGLGYSSGPSMILGLQPDNGVVDEPPMAVYTCQEMPYWAVTGLAYEHGELTADVSHITFTNDHMASLPRLVSLGWRDSSGLIHNAAEPQTVRTKKTVDGIYSTGTLTTRLRLAAAEGERYVLVPIESSDGHEWRQCLEPSTKAGTQRREVVIGVSGGKPWRREAHLTATMRLGKDSPGYTGMYSDIDIIISNDGEEDYKGKLLLYGSSTGGWTTSLSADVKAGATDTVTYAYKAWEGDPALHFSVSDMEGRELATLDHLFIAAPEAPRLSFTDIRVKPEPKATITAAWVDGRELQMPRVDEKWAEFEFHVRNDGGFWRGDVDMREKYAGGSGSSGGLGLTAFRAHSDTVLTYRTHCSPHQAVTMSARFRDMTIAPLATPNRYASADGTYYEIADGALCYIAGWDSLPPPQLSLQAITVAPLSGEKTWAECDGHEVEMDCVSGDVAQFTFTIRNDGGPYYGPILYQTSLDGNITGYYEIAAGSTADVTYTTRPHNGRVMKVRVYAHNELGQSVSLRPLDTPITHRRADGSAPLTLDYAEICYILGTASAVADTRSDAQPLTARGGKGAMRLTALRPATARIMNVAGATVAVKTLAPGTTVTLTLPAGIYLVEGKKVAVW